MKLLGQAFGFQVYAEDNFPEGYALMSNENATILVRLDDSHPSTPPKKVAGGGSTPKPGKKVRKPTTCKNCGETGHIAKTCGRKKEDAEAVEGPMEHVSKVATDEGLTDDQIDEIIEKFNEGVPPSTSSAELAKEYGVSIKTIWGIIRNRNHPNI